MTEQVQPIGQNQPVASASDSPSYAHTPSPVEPQEKMLRQSEVNEIVGKVKHDWYQRGKTEALNERPAQQNYGNSNVPQQPMQQQYQPNTQSVPTAPTIPPEQLRQMIAEETAKMTQAQQYERLASSFIGKVETGKKKFDDFDAVVTPLNLPQIPAIWQTAEGFENAADILYELGKNPAKLGSLLNVAYSPELVKREMQKISTSLQQNESASEVTNPNAPLSRPKPSNIGSGSGDQSKLNAQDWKKILKT